MSDEHPDSLSALAASAFDTARRAEPQGDVDPSNPAAVAAVLSYLLLQANACEAVVRKLAAAVDELEAFDINEPPG